MDRAIEQRVVAIIDRALTDVSHTRPVASEVVDVLLDLRLRVLEMAVFDWIESEQEETPGSEHAKRGVFAGLKRHP